MLIVVIAYTVLLVGLDWLQAPPLWDEPQYWQTSLSFSDRLIPSLDDLKNYRELNTPLPFIIFGGIEHLFGQGIFAGRLLNLLLSVTIIFIIGWPTYQNQGRAALCAAGLLLCPYFLWYSGLLYTDAIACFWVLIGFIGYIRGHSIVSCIAFILGIASRQYMIAFPVAIVAYELTIAVAKTIRQRQFKWAYHWRWMVPAIAVLSIFGWFYLFQGLAPEAGIGARKPPKVQETLWALTPGTAINFLSFVGFYIVIPEFILFNPLQKLRALGRSPRRKVLLITAALLVYCIIFPPIPKGFGTVRKLAMLMPHPLLTTAFFSGLALLACIRFSQANLMTIIVLCNSILMMKAFPWDKYVLPLAIVFWYLKSTDAVNKLSIKLRR